MVETKIRDCPIAALTATGAREQIERIKNHWQAFWFELKDFHDCQGWLPLGYTSFKACMEQELGISKQRAYQLLDAASMMEELNSQHVLTIDRATEGQLRELKLLEPARRIEIARQIDFANMSVREVREIVQRAMSSDKPHVAFNSGNNEWYTPLEYIEAARRVMGKIDLDPASSIIANQIVGASLYFTVEDDGLCQSWAGRVFMNPPYAAELIGKFIDKLTKHFADGDVPEAIVLVNNATETNWFQTLLAHASVVCYLGKRVKFVDVEGNSSGALLQGQAILYMGNNLKLFAEHFRQFGAILYG